MSIEKYKALPYVSSSLTRTDQFRRFQRYFSISDIGRGVGPPVGSSSIGLGATDGEGSGLGVASRCDQHLAIQIVCHSRSRV